MIHNLPIVKTMLKVLERIMKEKHGLCRLLREECRDKWILCKFRVADVRSAGDPGPDAIIVDEAPGHRDTLMFSAPFRVFTEQGPAWTPPGTKFLYLPKEEQGELPEFVRALVRRSDVIYSWTAETSGMKIDTFGL